MKTQTSSQDIDDQKQAIGRAYRLLGELALHGPVQALLPMIQAIPELAAALPDDHPDELAADHYQIFGLEIHSFESAFLEPQRILGGSVTESVLAAYLQADFSPPSDAEAGDHLGWELHFLSNLCEREARAAIRRDTIQTSRLRNWQYHFLGEHLLRWLPGLLQAVRRQPAPFYTALLELALALAVAHYEGLTAWAVEPLRPFTLPEAPVLLADQGTGLRDIAGYLLTPAYSGVYISRLDIRRLAKEQSLPRGFGDRQHMLTSLLRNAAEYEQMPALADRISAYVKDWGSGLEALGNSPIWGATLRPFMCPWVERSTQTAKLLGEIERLAADSQETGMR
jgi:TorA maturation chaperone TorD